MEGPWALPDGWRWERLGDFAHVNAGQSPASADCNRLGAGLPFFQGKAEFGRDTPTARNWCESPPKTAEAGDLLISVRAPVGPTNFAVERCGIGRGLAGIRPIEGDARWLRYWLIASVEALVSKATGTTFEAITGDVLRSHVCPLPPLETQREIVARIDALFDEVEDGEAALAHARADLGTWRKALLKAAVTGELTADWRAANPPLETGADLLARILAERRTRWCAEPRNKGKRYVEPAGPDTNALRELPEGWAWTSPAFLASWASGKFLPDREMRDGKIPVFGGNGITGQHDQANVEGPVLVIGRVGYYCGNAYVTAGPSWITDNAIYAGSLDPRIKPQFLRLVFETANLRGRAQGGAQPFVSQGLLNAVAVPLPSLDEQEAILAYTSAMIAEMGELYAELDMLASGTTTLRQCILAAAFRGALTA